MEAAFDIKDLQKRLEDKGLAMLENDLKFILETIMQWVEESIKVSPSKTDDIVIPFLPFVKALAEKYIEKIDGK